MAITPDFQSEDEVSITSTCSKQVPITQSARVTGF